MLRTDEGQFLTWALHGHAGAIDYVQTLGKISQTWDDLVDKDKPVSTEQINAMMRMALSDLFQNPFFVQNALSLAELQNEFMHQWWVANELETLPDEENNRVLSYVLRSAIGLVIGKCAELVGGKTWRRTIGVALVKFIYEDEFTDYLNSLKPEE
ncbi:MAG: hypothetical protein WBN04_04970 [Paracoccaceae bacterium]